MILEEFIGTELESLTKSLVATPETREDLDHFATGNGGCNDFILTQMAVQYGYKIGLEAVRDNNLQT